MEKSRSGADEKARIMADLIDRWIGNPVSKFILGFERSRESGRRAEKILMDYAGLDVDLSLGDRVAGHLFKLILGSILEE